VGVQTPWKIQIVDDTSAGHISPIRLSRRN
jgi:hypothetical protein